MAYLALRIMINALSIGVAVKLVDGITFTGEWWKMIIIGLIFGIVNSIIKPIITFFSLPLLVFTLGVFMLVINALMLLLTAKLSSPFNLGFHVDGFIPALIGSIIISIISFILSLFASLGRVK
ncbi:MAG: phage holin family protein [Thermodesulfovibrionales bacterium]|nr:phage holin family protein [Thermodesulfovibrionales bacterium]